MKKAFRVSLPLVLPFLFGCNAATLQVQGPGAPASSSSAPAPSVSGLPSQSSAPAPARSSDDSSKVFFERVLTQGEEIDQITEVSFASEASTTTTPVGIALKNAVDFTPSPLMAAGGAQVVYLQSNGVLTSSLVSTALGSFSTQTLYDFPSAASAISESLSAQKVAWIDMNGNASVSDLSSGQVVSLGLSGDSAIRVQLSADGSRVLVRTASGALDTFIPDTQTGWKQELSIVSVTAAALSADGTHLAYVKQDGSAYIDQTLVTHLDSAQVYDLRWSGDELSYWLRTSSGGGEIQVLSTSATQSGSAKTVGRISVPAWVGDGVVCPALDGNTLYFADFTGGEYQIERATIQPNGMMSHGEAFAVAPASDEGFICPVVAAGAL